MALFTGKGDGGTTKMFDSEPGKRISKASCRPEALGSLDEINSFLGLCKVKAKDSGFKIQDSRMEDIVHSVQQNLFIIQAEIAGADKKISEEKVRDMEEMIQAVEAELPPIKTFFIAGGTELAALFDVARTTARRAERRVVDGVEKGEMKISDWSKSYLNRLSSLLYALARLSNHKSGVMEEPPKYE